MNSAGASNGFSPSFNEAGAPFPPGAVRLSTRNAYYHLVNVEEHPEVLPLAYDIVQQRFDAAAHSESSAELTALAGPGGSLDAVLARLSEWRGTYAYPWRHDSQERTRRQVHHFFRQYMPTALVDGCWLQCGLRVCTAHTPVGSLLTELYAHQVRAYINDPGRHFVGDYQAAHARLGAPIEEVSSHSFAERADFLDASFALPVFLLALAQCTRSFGPEIVGLNLAWQFLDLSSFGPALIRDVCKAYELPSLGDDLGSVEHLERARELARKAADALLADGVREADTHHRLLRGIIVGVDVWQEWFARTRSSAPSGAPDPRQEMLDLLWRKAPHATGYHAEKMLGERRIDEHLNPIGFDGPAVLQELAKSKWVKAGQSDRSGLLRHLVKFGGPMLAVFSPVELQIIQNWIDGLPSKDAPPAPAESAPTGPTSREEEFVTGRAWTPENFRSRAESLHGKHSTRDLFYYLVNVEQYPDILPIAERFARDRLERSLAMLFKGDRPIPSRRYDPAALERWVYKKHRDQVDSYRPPARRPPVEKEAFIEVSVQLAPIVLIDGGWLQGIATSSLIHTVLGRMLFHVLVEEIGAGNPAEHHANIYRDLLAAMGETVPPVESVEFSRWARLNDESFEVPTLWLSMSCFPRHFLPEIIGLNLAVEIAGIGGPYMEARDTLKKFGYPTLFVDVHNAADNVAAGHSAWAMNTIKRYMDEVAEREGPHAVDAKWHRVWSGVRSTLPQISRARLIAHRLKKRFFGRDLSSAPLIFPS